jgi:hypothetical protein
MLAPSSWHALVSLIFTDQQRFIQTGRRRYQVGLDGAWAGLAIAWKPSGYENYGLNQQDLERLIEKIHDDSLAAGFVVLATIENGKPVYVTHRAAKAVYENLKDVPPRSGPYGDYWLLRGDFSVFDDLAIARERF